MTTPDTEQQFIHLMELGWELNELGFDSVVRLSHGREPSMEIFLSPDRRLAARQHGPTSAFTRIRSRHRGARTRAWARGVFKQIVQVAR